MANKKRLFLGLCVDAPWPDTFPRGRIIAPETRHCTLLFLGQQDEKKIFSLMPAMPPYPLPLGAAGHFDKCLFLPHHQPRVVSWHLDLGDNKMALSEYARATQEFFRSQGIELEHRNDWLPHATIAREPFFSEEWERSFVPLPFVITSCDLFESLGNLHYVSLWQNRFLEPFEKLPHTADIGYLVRGSDFPQLYHHARIALAFEFPPLLAYTAEVKNFTSIDDIVRALNQLVTAADLEGGSPFKAVSYHGNAKKNGNLLEWEMIVDV